MINLHRNLNQIINPFSVELDHWMGTPHSRCTGVELLIFQFERTTLNQMRYTLSQFRPSTSSLNPLHSEILLWKVLFWVHYLIEEYFFFLDYIITELNYCMQSHILSLPSSRLLAYQSGSKESPSKIDSAQSTHS